MRFNCVHTFTIEAKDPDEFYEKLARYGEKVRKASERLDIGYSGGLMCGQRASDGYEKRQDQPDPERLFDR